MSEDLEENQQNDPKISRKKKSSREELNQIEIKRIINEWEHGIK